MPLVSKLQLFFAVFLVFSEGMKEELYGNAITKTYKVQLVKYNFYRATFSDWGLVLLLNC